MSGRIAIWGLRLYLGAVFLFIFLPIAVSFIVSFNLDRFPTLPLGGFSTKWYEDIAADPTLPPAIRHTVVVGAIVALLSTLLGFGAAYTDFRYRFFGKAVYLALALLPPTIPVVILGLAMLVFLSQVSLFGALHSVVISHVVFCLPFTLPAILSALFITMAVSFDEFAIAWFVSGFNETLPVRILAMFQGQVSPRINAIGSIVFTVTMTLVILAQLILIARRPRQAQSVR
jgi:spermidine/putrescine transport system permease protein